MRLLGGRHHLRLRSKLSLLFGLIALIAGVSVAIVAYTFARTSLLDQDKDEARATAINNAQAVANRLGDRDLLDFVSNLGEQDHFSQVIHNGELLAAAGSAQFADATIFPDELRAFVDGGDAGVAGMQRFRHAGKPYIGVGISLAQPGWSYFEAFPLASTEQTLRTILLTFSGGAALAVLLFGAMGIWTGRRLLRPLGRVTTAAGEIATGTLTTRLAAERDPDLSPLVDAFNGMANAVQTRIERETRFASDVSHELRSPITALQAATDVLERRRDEFDERSRQAVDVIIDQVRRFDSMVLDLLELARIDAGAAELHVEQVDLADAARRIAAHYGLAALPIEASPGAARYAMVDRVRFERVLGNLLTNAKVHADGPVRVTIEPDRDGDRDFVEIAVEDAGPGVDPAERDHIFDRFARGRESRHRVGTGLGLALVAEHSAALRGAAWVEDRSAGGARFVVRLPAAPDLDGILIDGVGDPA